MTIVRLGILLSLLMLFDSASVVQAQLVAAYEAPPFFDFGPPTHVSRWIGLDWAGPMTAPISSMFYSTELGKRPPRSGDGYAVLDHAKYERLSEFVHSYNCSSDPIGFRPPYPNTIRVEELAHRHTRVLCFLSRTRACDFLLKLSGLRAAAQTNKSENFALWELWLAIGCTKDTNPFPNPRG
jgi:hypothetical protein